MPRRSVSFTSRIGVLRHLPGMRYLEIPRSAVLKLGGGFRRRVVCTVNGKLKFQAGLMALGAGKAYISITRKRMKELGVSEGDRVKVTLAPDESRFGMTMSPELQELLAQDDAGRGRFETLPPSQQRYIIQYVGTLKNPDRRLDRAILLLDNLKRITGKVTFRKVLGIDPPGG